MSKLPVSMEGFGGGNASLNFKVVGNPQPTGHRENTIWINTDRKITGYSFSAMQPEAMAEGEVWISTGKSSPVAFNALKKNCVMVYPLKAKQMVSGSLVERTAKIYQNGEWREWTTYLFVNGDECVDVTGGWQSVMDSDSCTLTKEITDAGALRMTARANGNHRKGFFYTDKEIDLSDAECVKINITEFQKNYGSGDYEYHDICISAKNTLNSPVAQAKISAIGEMSIDVSNLQGSYVVAFFLGGPISGEYATVATDRIWLD